MATGLRSAFRLGLGRGLSTAVEVQVDKVLGRSGLVIVRDVPWAGFLFGAQQENQFKIIDPCNLQSPIGFINEKSNVIARQILGSKCPFVAEVTDAFGNQLFKIRRPFSFETSYVYTEMRGKEVGVVLGRGHPWKRIYDLYLGKECFAVIENPGFHNWTFTLKGLNGEVLAQINRGWAGIDFEVFADASRYFIQFGSANHSPNIAGYTHALEEVEVTRPLTLLERAVVVAFVVCLEKDYFSDEGGWLKTLLPSSQ